MWISRNLKYIDDLGYLKGDQGILWIKNDIRRVVSYHTGFGAEGSAGNILIDVQRVSDNLLMGLAVENFLMKIFKNYKSSKTKLNKNLILK
ncbi:unnamed protein product [Meloidogyne enterolobii]|uniref:Uncharacterized protein n=1 Tax=Meloidogyne enterolobii TaxID=390850 RepID=A0ACB1AF78_MELEN